MTANNLKRGLHRIFLTATIAWIFWCAVLPIRHRANFVDNLYTILVDEEHDCQTDTCKQEAREQEKSLFEDNSVSKWYREEWWVALLLAITVPLLVYGVLRAIIALALWVSRGFSDHGKKKPQPEG
jgi:hypothetical protein